MIRKNYNERLAKLVGGVAVLKGGDATEIKVKERKDRVDNALDGTIAAVEEGIVPRGGVTLLNVARTLDDLKGANDDQQAGKTLVALTIVYSGAKTAFMAPTDLLSAQHYQFFCNALENTSIKEELLTGKSRAKQQLQLKKDLADGKIDILIRTHVLFQKCV